MLDPESEIFVVHIILLSSVALPSYSSLDIYPFRRLQIASLITEEAPIKVFVKYADFADVFSPDLASKLPKHTKINNHTIKLDDG